MHLRAGRYLAYGLGLLLAAGCLMAQTINNIDVRHTEILDSDQIDIDGHYNHYGPPPPHDRSAADRLAEERRQQERNNEDKTRRRLETMRLQAERDIGRRLNRALETYPGPEGAVVPLGPVPPGPIPPAGPSFFHQLRYSVYYGFMKFNSNWYDFNSKFRWGLTAEGNLNPNVAMGLYFNYVSVEDLSMDMGWYNNYYYGGGGTPPGQQQFDQTMWSFGMFAKYYFQNWNAVRPYIYGGLGYNHITTRYSGAGWDYYYQRVFVKSEYTSSSFSAQLAGGMLLEFSPNFGMFAQLGAAFNFASNQASYSLNEAEERSKALEDATAFDIAAGASFRF